MSDRTRLKFMRDLKKWIHFLTCSYFGIRLTYLTKTWKMLGSREFQQLCQITKELEASVEIGQKCVDMTWNTRSDDTGKDDYSLVGN